MLKRVSIGEGFVTNMCLCCVRMFARHTFQLSLLGARRKPLCAIETELRMYVSGLDQTRRTKDPSVRNKELDSKRLCKLG